MNYRGTRTVETTTTTTPEERRRRRRPCWRRRQAIRSEAQSPFHTRQGPPSNDFFQKPIFGSMTSWSSRPTKAFASKFQMPAKTCVASFWMIFINFLQKLILGSMTSWSIGLPGGGISYYRTMLHPVHQCILTRNRTNY